MAEVNTIHRFFDPLNHQAKSGSSLITDGDPKVKTPQYVIKIGELLSSGMEKMDKFCTLYDFSTDSARTHNPNTIDALQTGGSLHATDLMVLIPSASYCANLQSKMNNGEMVGDVTIQRLAGIGQEIVVVYQAIFGSCYINYAAYKGDKSLYGIRYSSKIETFTDYDQDGTKQGNTSVAFDYAAARGIQGGA